MYDSVVLTVDDCVAVNTVLRLPGDRLQSVTIRTYLLTQKMKFIL